MKIGILTFHWATNYGAVLQTYATQTFLRSIGHDVVVINYKPKLYDLTLKTILREFKRGHFISFIEFYKKEVALKHFRNKYLNQTERIMSISELPQACSSLDCIISGSDQIMNPSFLRRGEGRNTVTPSYFLGFDFPGKRIGYAISFGVVSYPEMETEIAKPFIDRFDKISTREESGAKIVETMGRPNVVVVPDPTIFFDPNTYHRMADSAVIKCNFDTFCFFIRNIKERKATLHSVQLSGSTLWNNEDGNFSLEGWLAKIKYAKFVITDSFHCMVMCLKLHTPFAVITELEGNTGMNDRLYTLLGLLGMEARIVYKKDISKINNLLKFVIDWNTVDRQLLNYKKIGEEFLISI